MHRFWDVDVCFGVPHAAHCALLCVRFSCTKDAFCSDDVPSADRVEGPGLRHAAPRKRLLSPSPPVLQWGGTGKEPMSRNVTGRQINAAEKTPPAGSEAGHDGLSMTGEAALVASAGPGAQTPLPSQSASSNPAANGSGELTNRGGAEFQLLQGLHPGITGSFLRDFKAEPGVPQGAGLRRGASQRYPTDGGVASRWGHRGTVLFEGHRGDSSLKPIKQEPKQEAAAGAGAQGSVPWEPIPAFQLQLNYIRKVRNLRMKRRLRCERA